jgi:aspartate racemase
MNPHRIDVFLTELKNKNVKLWLEGNDLKYKGPKKIVTPELVLQIKGHYHEIISFFRKSGISSNQDIIDPRIGIGKNSSSLSLKEISIFLKELKNKKVKVWLEGGKLKYKGPKKAVTPELVSQLKERLPEITAFFSEYGGSSNEDVIYPRINQDQAPLSSSQHRFWFLSQLESDSPLYHINWAIKLTGNLNLEILQKSLNNIVQRHEVLRTSFTSRDGEAVQIIQKNFFLEIPVIDLTNLSATEQDTRVQKELYEQSVLPFDLRRDLMLRVCLLKLKQQEYVLLFVFHHIAADGWSLGIFFKELVTLYRAYLLGIPSPLPDLKIQYADFAVWQKSWLTTSNQSVAKQLTYWSKQLKNLPSLLNLPTDRPRPEIQTFKGAKYNLTISSSLTHRLKEISQQEKVTLFMTLLAGFKILLCRYSGEEDILVGTPIANRTRVELENLIGIFVNTLILRTQLRGNPTFRQLLLRVKRVTLGAYTNQELPLEKIIEQIQPERYKSSSSLFQVLFVLQNAPKEKLELSDLTITRLNIKNPTAKFDLSLSVSETESGLKCGFEYNTDLFDHATIARMAEHWKILLEGISSDLNQRILEVPILSSQEKSLFREWNNTRRKYPEDLSIQKLFEHQAERIPENIALVWGEEKLNYYELNCRANQLANYLKEIGITRGTPVGIYLERSPEIIMAILAILKAGGVYVPLAPSYPKERIAFMIGDSGVEVILTQGILAEKLPSSSAQITDLDTQKQVISQYSQNNLPSDIKGENQAYIMYTSGSTGQPKGVSITHKGVVRLVKNCDYVDLNSTEVLLQLAPISFDASTFEIWGALLNGGTLVLSPLEKPSLEELNQMIQNYQITTLWLTSGLFNVIVDQKIEAFKGLRQLLTGGDVLSLHHVQKFAQKYPECELINGYGPTENTTFSCCYQIKNAEQLTNSVPIGKPISNTQAYILDSRLQEVPIGITGEIYLGGDGLALGYVNRPELTAAKFIDNPFGKGKLYKTGDFGRYLPDGNIQFFGRIDNQVKIRGFRIEPSEIQAVINQYDSVNQSVVLPKEDNLGNKILVAYLTYFHNRKVSLDELRLFLQKKLPSYMIPDDFVLLDGFPLTIHGKIDYKALQSFNHAKTASQSSYVAPRTHLELQIVKIWEQVLGVKSIGIRDNFFELGGHSLLALTLFAKIEQLCKVTIPMATLFSAPTVEQLTAIIRQKGWSTSWLSLVPLKVSGAKPPLFYVHGVLGTVLSARHLGKHLDEEQPIYGIQAQGLQEKKLVHHRVEDMAAAYVKEIKTVQPTGPYCLVGVSTGGIIALEMAQQLYAENKQVAFLGFLDTQKPATSSGQNLETTKHSSFLETFKSELPDDAEIVAFLEANYEIVVNQYKPKSYPGTITFFLAEESASEKENQSIAYWRDIAQGKLHLHRVPGNHLSMIEEENAPVLAAKVQQCLNQALDKEEAKDSL